jgi:DNA polymerase
VDSRALAQHLRFYQELGVTGINRDAGWRRRISDGADGARGSGLGARISVPETPSPEDQFSRSDTQPNPESRVPSPDLGESPSIPVQFIRSAEGLHAIRDELGDCTRCKLHTLGRKQIVFGVGNPAADIMFVGEAPGADEDQQGIPFVGRAGQLLTKIIEAIDLKREDVYIANVIKCRPPQNRNPEQDEVETCEPFLFRQIDVIKPRVIVALGTFAARTLLRTLDPISRLRGRVYDYRGAKLIPTFHPAYLLRNPASKREVWEDMKLVKTLLESQV